MNFIKNTNLPTKKVTAVLISEDAGEPIFTALKNRNIEPIKVPRCKDIAEPVASHPDMLFHCLENNKIVYYKNIDKSVCETLNKYGFKLIQADSLLKKDYPNDIALNAARIGNKLFCRKDKLDGTIKKFCEGNNIHIINVKQGYSKCSICVVDNNSIITADKSIAKAAEDNNVNVLLINSGNITLKGYDTGFIGGCCGKSDKHTIMFCGNINNHPDGEKIKQFLAQRKINIDNLTNDSLLDVGSIIPLVEE